MGPPAWLPLTPPDSVCWHFFTQQSWLIMQLRATWFCHFLWQTDRQTFSVCGSRAGEQLLPEQTLPLGSISLYQQAWGVLLMAIRSPPAGPVPPESPRFCVCTLSSDGVGGAVTPETIVIIENHFQQKSQVFWLASRCIDFLWQCQLKSHVLRVRNQSDKTRREPDDTSITRGFKTIRGRRSCRHVDDVSALLSPGLARLSINVSSSNRSRPSRLSTWGKATSSTGGTRGAAAWVWDSQRLRQLQQPPISVSGGFQTVIRGPPRGPEGFRLTKSRVWTSTGNLCHHTGRLKKNKTGAPGFYLPILE